MVMHLSGSGGIKLLVTSHPVSVTWVVPAAPATLWLVKRDSISSSSPTARYPFPGAPEMSGQPSRHAPAPFLDGGFQKMMLPYGMVCFYVFMNPDRIAHILGIGLAGVIPGACGTSKSHDNAHDRAIDDRQRHMPRGTEISRIDGCQHLSIRHRRFGFLIETRSHSLRRFQPQLPQYLGNLLGTRDLHGRQNGRHRSRHNAPRPGRSGSIRGRSTVRCSRAAGDSWNSNCPTG